MNHAPSDKTLAQEAGAPLTMSQALIWAGQKLAPDAPLYNMGWRFDLHLALDTDRFVKVFHEVALESDGMSAVFVEQDGMAQQQLGAAAKPDVEIVDLSGEDDPSAAADAWIDARIARNFDLSDCAYDAALLKLEPARWVWFLNQHHIATDALAASLIFKAVSARYGEVTTAPLPAFADYATAEAGARDAGERADARAYWSAREADGVSEAAPYGVRRGPATSRSRRVPVEIGIERSARLAALTGQAPFQALSPHLATFAMLFTVYAAFLHRTLGEKTISIGAPAHNRGTAAARETIGLFIEMFPMRVEIDEDESFVSLHRKVMAEAYAYLKNAQPGASSAATASLFRNVLNYIPVAFGPFAGAPAEIEWRHCGHQDPRHDLRLHVYDFAGDGVLAAAMDLNDAAFDGAAAASAPKHFLNTLDAFLADPEGAIAAAPLADAAEMARLIAGHDGPPATDIDAAATLPQMFRRQAAKTPDAAAVRLGDELMSYRELADRADAWAAALAAAGVGPGDAVVVAGARSSPLPAAILGVLQAGAYFAPVPASAPAARLAAIVDDVGPACILADAATAAAAAATGRPVLRLDQAPPEPAAAARPLPEAGDLAYVMFTSGSTGAPKGVAVTHGGLAGYLQWAVQSYSGGAAADYAFFTSIGFDLTLTSLFAPLISGGAVVIYPESGGEADLAVLDVFRDDAVDVAKLTPSHLALAAEGAAKCGRIKTLILGGENLTTALCRRAQDWLGPDLAIFNEYGPTEAVVGCMIHRFDAAADDGASVPIGRPAAGAVIRILDAAMQPAPDGVAGEIYIGGDRLAAGYHGRPDLTTARFVADPHRPGARLYKTGDLARRRPDGVVEFLGRADDQVKLRGVRIEPAEIEAALERVDGVSAAFVELWRPQAPARAGVGRHCARCGLADDYPGAALDDAGVCAICRDFEGYRERAEAYFQPPEELRRKIEAARQRRTGKYDAIMLFSGGKDSSYALYRLHELTPDILALTLDNGFISDGAKANIKRITDDLGVEHRFMTTEAMNAIFVDSLKRNANVCHGCFKTIYTLATRIALEEGAPAVVTGLSRGQFFETRLTPEMFQAGAPSAADIDRTVLEARKSYHRIDDAVADLLDTCDLQKDEVFEAVEFIDFYRYVDVPVAEVYRLLREHAPWVRPGDTGRSTNCLINDVGIFVHKRREGFHNYALPYSWDVRMGHKTRDEAMAELDDAIDPDKVRDILAEIGLDEEIYEPAGAERLIAYYVAGRPIDPEEMATAVRAALPREMAPTSFFQIDAMPLTANGKVDREALPRPARQTETAFAYTAPAPGLETAIARIWRDVLGAAAVGAHDNFYDLGGDSIAAIQIAARAGQAGHNIAAIDIFECPTVSELARRAAAADAPAPEPEAAQDAPLLDLDAASLDAVAQALARRAT